MKLNIIFQPVGADLSLASAPTNPVPNISYRILKNVYYPKISLQSLPFFYFYIFELTNSLNKFFIPKLCVLSDPLAVRVCIKIPVQSYSSLCKCITAYSYTYEYSSTLMLVQLYYVLVLPLSWW